MQLEQKSAVVHLLDTEAIKKASHNHLNKEINDTMNSSSMVGRRRYFIYNAHDYEDRLLDIEKDHILSPSKEYFKVIDFFLMHELSPESNFDEFIEILMNEKDDSLIEDKIEQEMYIDEAKMKGEFMKQNLNKDE